MPESEPDPKDIVLAELEARRKKQAAGLKKAILRQEALAILCDRYLTRAVNDPARKGPLPPPSEVRKTVERFVPQVLVDAAKWRAATPALTAHDAIVAAAEALEKKPAKTEPANVVPITRQPQPAKS